MFLAGYGFSPPEVRAVLRAVVIFMTSTAFLFSIYIPKIYIIMDTKINVEEERAEIRERVKKFSCVATAGPKLIGLANDHMKPRPSCVKVEEGSEEGSLV